MKITPLSLALLLAAAAAPSVAKKAEDEDATAPVAAIDEEARRKLGMPGATHVNVTSVVVNGDNTVNVTVERTDGWFGDDFGIYAPENNTKICKKGGYADADNKVTSDFITFSKGPESNAGFGNDEKVVYFLDVIEANLTSAPFWYPTTEGDDSKGSIELCVQADLTHNVSSTDEVSVGYDVSKIKLDVDVSNATFSLTAGATADDVTTSTEEFSNIYNVTVFVCGGTPIDGVDAFEADYEERSTPLPIRQNQRFRICARTSSPDVEIAEIVIDEAENGDGDDLVNYIGVDAGSAPRTDLVEIVHGLTAGDPVLDDGGRKITELRFFALALMFEGTTPELTLGGRAKLAFAATAPSPETSTTAAPVPPLTQGEACFPNPNNNPALNEAQCEAVGCCLWYGYCDIETGTNELCVTSGKRRLVEQQSEVSIALRGLQQGAAGDDSDAEADSDAAAAGSAALALKIDLAPAVDGMADEDVSHSGNVFHNENGEEGPSNLGAAGVDNKDLETYSAASANKKGFGLAAAAVLGGAAAALL